MSMLQIAVKNDEGFTGRLSLNQRRVQNFTLLSPRTIAITKYCSAQRHRVERFIEQTFHQAYGAEIRGHYPTLMSVHDEEDTILAAVGFRFAKEEPLFLEQYLNVPVEQLLRDHDPKPVEREVIVEVGNLASLGQGASIFLFAALNGYLSQQGIKIVTFTATDFLHRYFTKLGMNTIVLGEANQGRLQDGGHSWGTYYKTNPRVISGSVKQVVQGLHGHLQVVLETSEAAMNAQLHPKPLQNGIKNS
ncbi:MAG: thermostable hemolysin [Nitrospirota bacterium]|nr:thermostable hemolysin [Nitrospirota bacterium]